MKKLCLIIFVTCLQSVTQAQTATALKDSSKYFADQIVDSKIPVLVDFWAPWCGPCKMLTPILNELEKNYHGKVLFLRINIDIHQRIASYFNISSIPAIIIIDHAAVSKVLMGYRPKPDYISALDSVIAVTSSTPPAAPTTPQDLQKKK